MWQSSDSVWLVPASQREYKFLGVNPEYYYTIGIRAYRSVNKAINASGIILSPITQTSAFIPNATPNITANVGGISANNIAAAWAYVSSSLDDNVLSGGPEKTAMRAGWDALYANKAGLIAQASSLGVSSTAYQTAFQNFANYLNGSTWSTGVPTFIQDWALGVNTTFNGSTGRALLTALESAINDLANALNTAASQKAVWSGISNIPGQIYATNLANSWGVNPSFSDWSGTYPDNWVVWGSGGTLTKDTSIVRVGKNSVKIVSPSNAITFGTCTTFSVGASTLDKNTIISGSIDVYIVAGNTGTPGILLTVLGPPGALSATWFSAANSSGWSTLQYTVRGDGTNAITGLAIYIGTHGTWGFPFVGTCYFQNLIITINSGTDFDNKLQQWNDVNSIPAYVYNTNDAVALGVNPGFEKWTNAASYPDGWLSWNGPAPTRETSIVRNGNYAAKYICSGTDIGMVITSAFSNPASDIIITGSIDIHMSARTSGLPGIFIGLVNVAGTAFIATASAQPTSTTTGIWQRVSFTVRGNGVTPVGYIHVYCMGSWTTMASGPFTGTTIFDNLTFTIQKAADVDNKWQVWSDINSTPSPLASLTNYDQVKNSLISIANNGTLSGGGGGQVTISGLGYSGSLQATKNTLTSSTVDPSGGGSGDWWYNSATQKLWANVGGSWTNQQIKAASVETGWLSAQTISAGQITTGTLSAVTIDTSGYGRFRGAVSAGGYNASIVANDSQTQSYGIYAYGSAAAGAFLSSSGTGVSGQSSTSDGVSGYTDSGGAGVRGTSTSGYGVYANSTYGYSLYVAGLSYFGNTTYSASTGLNTNFNADLLDGYHASSFSLTSHSHNYLSGINCYGGGTAWAMSGMTTIRSNISGYQFYCYGSNGIEFNSTSDERLKQDIEDETLGLDFVNSLRPITYRWVANSNTKFHGFIAQEVHPLVPGPYIDSLKQIHPDGVLALDYMSLISPLVKAIQEQTLIINQLQTRITQLENQNANV